MRMDRIWGSVPRSTSMYCWKAYDAVGLLGILLGLGLLIWLSYRGWSVLLWAPVAALQSRSAP
jgi:hypothetical protein